MSPAMISILQKNWFLWPLALAILLELFGLGVNAYYMCNPTKREAFLLSYAPTLVAPILLGVANFSIFHRLISWTITASNRASHPVWQAVHSLASLFPVLGATPIILYAMGFSDLCRYLSSAPIDSANEALARILFNERGQRMLFHGHVAALVCLGVFAVLAVASFASAPRVAVSGTQRAASDARSLFWAVSSVNALCLVRIVFKVVQYLNMPEPRAALQACGRAFWLADCLPVLVAMAVLCCMHPAQYLPEQFAGVMYDFCDGDEGAEDAERWRHDEKLLV